MSLSIILLMSTAFVGGCSQGMTEAHSVLQGWVSAYGPVSEATITVYSTSGKKIYSSGDPVTGDHGSFLVPVKNLPEDFRIVASDGNCEGQKFSGELIADYRGFNPETDTVYINAVTTMVSSYLDKNEDKTLQEAEAVLKAYLEIPEYITTGSGLIGSYKYFNPFCYMQEAESNGGFTQFTGTLVTGIGPSSTTRAFVFEGGTNELLQGVGSDVAGFVAGGLATGALSYLGGNVMGWGMSQLGLGFGDKTAEALEEIKHQLEVLQEQMKQMQQQLVQISQQLDHLEAQMQQLGNQLLSEIKQTNYDTRVGQMISLINSICSIRNSVTVFVSNPPADIDVMNYQRDAIMTRIENELLNHENDINSQLTGIGMSTPLLKVWSQIVKSQHLFLTSADSARVKAQFDYFDTIQLWLTELLVEYHHTKATAEETGSAMYTMHVNNANAVITTYNTNKAAQQSLLLPVVPEGILYERDQNIFVKPQLYYGTWFEMLRQDFGLPPKFAGENMYYAIWRFAARGQIEPMFNIASGSPHSYVVNQGWPATELNRTWTIGEGYPDSETNSKVKVFSLSDGATRLISDGSDEKVYWVLITYPSYADPETDTDYTVQYFW